MSYDDDEHERQVILCWVHAVQLRQAARLAPNPSSLHTWGLSADPGLPVHRTSYDVLPTHPFFLKAAAPGTGGHRRRKAPS
jgi:hypothetical protein